MLCMRAGQPCHTEDMASGKRLSPELIAILSVGAALMGGLGGLVLTLHGRTDARMMALETRMAALEQRQSRLEGLIEGAAMFAPSQDASD